MVTPRSGTFLSLREKAEGLLNDLLRRYGDACTLDVKDLLRELSVHQIELEMQNDELSATQQQLQGAAEKYSQLFDFAPVGFLTLNRNGVLVDLNLEAARLLGADRSRLRDRPLTPYVAPADHVAFFTHLSRAFETGVPHTTLLTVHGRTAGERLVEMRTVCMDLAPGERPRCLCSLTDMTERIRAEEGLMASEERFRLVVERTPSGVFLASEDGTLEYVNPALCQLLGHAAEDLVGRPFTRFVPEADRADLDTLRRTFMDRGGPALGERRVERRDGEVRTVLADAAVLRGRDGRPKLAAFMVDITDRIQAEQQRCEVERMTRHDLKVPLNALVNIPDLVRDAGPVTAEQAELLDMAKSSSQAMAGMINIFLDISRIESGTYHLEPDPVDLLDLARRITREFGQSGLSRHSELRITVRGRRPAVGQSLVVAGDELLLYAMLGNLLQNALEASPKGAAVEMDFVRKGNRTLAVIRNQGEVPEPVRERFFEKYATHGKKSGTGLGTYSARLIARVHGGDITLDTSIPGQTTVTVSLP